MRFNCGCKNVVVESYQKISETVFSRFMLFEPDNFDSG